MITPRLDMILRNVSAQTVADIGTDHAFIPIELAKRGKKVIATDANEGPLLCAKKNIKKHSLFVELRLGNGLCPLKPKEAEEIIIAGMGGELIKTIIEDNRDIALSSRLILQPMNSQAELRRYLLENGFKITSEDLSKEGAKIYNLIIAQSGKMPVPTAEIDFHLPPLLYNHTLFPLLCAKKEREFSKQYNGISKSKTVNITELARIERLLAETKRLKKDVIF